MVFEENLPFGPPPVLPDITDELKEFLLHPERLPIHDYERCQLFWPREPEISELFHYENSPLCTTLKVQRDPFTGKILEFREVAVTEAGLTAKNSTSLNRAPGPPTETTRGSASNYPFWPGGFPDPILELPTEENIDLTKDFLTIPPGFSRGLQFREDGCTLVTDSPPMTSPESSFDTETTDLTVNLLSIVQQEQDLLGLWSDNKTSDVKNTPTSILETLKLDDGDFTPEEVEIPVLNITETVKKPTIEATEWVEKIDINTPVLDFHKRIPDPAQKFDFELDNFQKQAIIKLEEHQNVFVTAHTSAGKTVVAEYAIALSKRHMTRTIYTSPIKALSNQKYHDFKTKFKDVGLITGDFQINQTASCLIMTTEILRSMLYCGSDVTRDLEYVIFDEVHYINDADRGHVWEEVLILLPAHVTIVMLSATVPNFLEFGGWVGRTKQRKVYVISNTKRPVPLVHYLYVGFGGQSKNVTFKILDADGQFSQAGYAAAKEMSEKAPQVHKLSKNREKTLWKGIIARLQKDDNLPVVAFTLSRKRCDENADALCSLDLNTSKEKHQVFTFFHRSIQKLKEPDRMLPQVLQMKQCLERGIGVHHSGILPILKEIVEMLFQRRLVKILFATETFAMGVNMPTRTVIFDEIRKYDGQVHRELYPAEYIQMAGRAGRRGMDSTGTVILLCKTEVPPANVFKTMMQGAPEKLSSRFRITYGMVLNLLRVEVLTVESMISHSFYEVNHRSSASSLQLELKKTEEALAQLPDEIAEHLVKICEFYDAASTYIKKRVEIWPNMLQNLAKMLVPGRVLLINHQHHYNKLGLLLDLQPKKSLYKVLVLTHQDFAQNSDTIDIPIAAKDLLITESPEKPDDYYKMLALTVSDIFVPDGVGGHTILDISACDISEVTNVTISLDTTKVTSDWEKRQMARFRDCAPAQTCNQAIQELTKLTHNVAFGGADPGYVDIKSRIKMLSPDMLFEIETLEKRKSEVQEKVAFTKISNFESHFERVYKKKHLEDKHNYLKYKISYESMSLYPEYQNRLELLTELGYIDNQRRVQLKGRVACEIGTNELIVTELVLRNTLTNMTPEEVAALLSCLVFQAKSVVKPELTEKLKAGKKAIEDIEKEIIQLERRYQIDGVDRTSSSGCLNFQLVEVVYKWAQQKPFAEIMTFTDIQEGIIVRCIQQLNETLRDVKDAARIIGDPKLQAKMDEASNTIKRDIVFAASLYTTPEQINE